MTYRFYLTVLFLLLLKASVFSQLKSFPDDPQQFISTMQNFVEGNDKKGTKLFFETRFNPYFNGLSDQEKKEVINISNLLLSRRALADPQFNLFIRILVSLKEKSTPSNYTTWLASLKYLVNNKKVTMNAITDFMENSQSLIDSKCIYKSSIVDWRISNPDYVFQFDGNEIWTIIGNTTLTCLSREDSSVIRQTQGKFYPLTRKFEGVGGKITWERAGFPENEVYAMLKNYNIDLSKNSFEIDSVVFVNSRFFDYPLTGKVTEKVMPNIDTANAIYPMFTSYSKRYSIKKIYPDVDYEGGFTMKGAKFIGAGTDEEPAFLNFYRSDTLFLTASSKSFAFREDIIAGMNTKVTFYIEKDSIFHPGLNFRFFIKKRELMLTRIDEGMGRSPYIDTYHQLEMDFDLLTWKMEEPKVHFKALPGSDIKKANFESMDFFNMDRYQEMQGMDDANPLQYVAAYSKKAVSREFNVNEFAKFLKASLPQTKQYLLRLAYNHFITYNPETGDILVRDKTFNYINCSVGKRDFDAINFVSNVVGEDHNATWSLLDNNLRMKGVREIKLSEVHTVTIFPMDQEITIKKNRDFIFNGRILAGLFLFKGSNFYFNYDRFMIDLVDVNEVKMRVKSGDYDEKGLPIEVDVKNVITNLTGELQIDDMNNKSGVKPLTQYPILNSKKDCYVYYDAPAIFDGVYKRDHFYFQIYPFVMDSLDKLTRKNLLFSGHFVSAGIFPPFDDILSVQKDYSLGFKRNTPANGFPAYGGKGTYYNEIYLSNNGLRGKGTLDFLTCHTESDDYKFFPDSMRTIAKTVEIKSQDKGTEYPPVIAENIDIRWLPYKDRMEMRSRSKPFDLFKGQATLEGMLAMEPTGLTGSGKMDFNNAELHSDLFKFKTNIIDADTSFFNLKGVDSKDFAFKTTNVNSHIDFTKRTGEFRSNGEASFVEFPQNQYICFMDQFTWFMDKEEIEMSASSKAIAQQNVDPSKLSPTELEDVQLQGSKFISIHPDQDSLSFVAPSAKYNIRKNIISANEVKFIRVADATVYPSDGKVVIEKRAVMQTLSNSKIIANNTNRYHTMYDATTNVYGKKNYTSSGKYDYTDETAKPQTIYFSVIGVDSTYQTYATGEIGITDGFTLSPNFAYTGKVTMNANEEFLMMDGSTKINHDCEKVQRPWINFTTRINPKEILIPIGDEIKEINNANALAGFYITNDSIHIYPAFLAKRKNYSDIAVVRSSGYLTFDKPDGKYKIASKDKLVEFNLPGNYLSLHKTACNMYGEGKMDLGVNLDRISTTQVGSMNHDLVTDNMYIEMLLGLNFFLPDKCIEIMAKDINTMPGLEAVDLSRSVFEKGMAEILGKTKANEVLAEFSLGRMKRMPKELEHTLFINDLTLKWKPAAKAYVNEGSIGIGIIGKEYINRMVAGHVEIIKKRSGDKISIYLELDESNWYFFNYTRGVMQVASSNETFMNVMKELKPDQRKLPTEKGEKPYAFYPVAATNKNKFLKHILSVKAGDEEIIPDEDPDDKEKKKGNEEE